MAEVLLNSKRFISIKWKAFCFTSLLLSVIFIVFVISSNFFLDKLFRDQRIDANHRYVEQIDAIVDKTANDLELMSSVFPYIEGMRQALLSKDVDALRNAFNLYRFQMELDLGLNAAVVLTATDEPLLWMGEPNIPPDFIQKFRETWKPLWTVTCFDICNLYLAAPLLMGEGMEDGTLILGASLSDVLARFENISRANVGVAVRRDDHVDIDESYLSQWHSQLVAVTHSEMYSPLIRKAATLFSRELLIQGIIYRYKKRSYHLLLKPLKGAVFPRQGELIIVEDVTSQQETLASIRQNGLMFLSLGLVFSELILLATLWGPLNRLRQITSTLPLLATGQFSLARKEMKLLFRESTLRDESDVLNITAISLSHKLEALQDDLKERAKQLEIKTSDLQEEKQFANGILDTAHALILTQNDKSIVTMVNPHCMRLTGALERELVGHSFFQLIPKSDHLPDLQFQLNELLNHRRSELHHESLMSKRDGSTLYMSWHHTLLPDTRNGQLVLSIALDISERKEAEERLGWLASHDTLTGLYNRRRFSEELEKCIAQSKRYGGAGAVLFFDLDQFKDVNDTSGHQTGDTLLSSVADLLHREARETDLIFRLGGDEFAMILREVDGPTAGAVAGRMCDALTGIEVQGRGRVHRVSSSIGVALFPEHGEYVDELLANADIAMYQAKDAGRNGWHLFEPGEQDKARIHERVYWNEKIKEALADDLLQLVFQPIQSVMLGSTSHYEALLRVYDEDGDLLPTYKFVLFAEKSGLIQEVDLQIVEKSFIYKQKLERRNVNATIAINLSGVSFRNVTLNQSIVHFLETYDVKPEEIIFEITETAAVEDVSDTAMKMRELKQLGFKFALDDFGVGFSSLYHLKQLPLDYVKIDGSFIKHLPNEPEDQALVRAVVEVSKVFGLRTVAEFVEDDRTLKMLSQLGVDYAQGYYIDKPKPWGSIWGEDT
ncbi:hypothetical protein A9Q81_05795 [Gammaproteobacteria bacterium 42_54_T18]|nr:hypothetical protein A9Q81_05795 [Gammaproteobacteria bacterium 42_54_T18]